MNLFSMFWKQNREQEGNRNGSELSKEAVFSLSTGEVLTFDRKLGVYKGRIPWLGVDCWLYLQVEEGDVFSAQSAVRVFEEIHREQERWDQQVKEYAAMKFIQQAKEWQAKEDPEDAVITEEAFVQQLEMALLSVCADGSFSFSLDEDEFFYGNWLIISGNLEQGFLNAEIEE